MTQNKYENLPPKNWQVNYEKLEEFGVEPGVYSNYQGGEYLTLSAGWLMKREGKGHVVGEKVVWYVALYDHPEYGPNANWARPVDDFVNGTVEVDGQTAKEFTYLRIEP